MSSSFNWWCLLVILPGLYLLWDALRGLLGSDKKAGGEWKTKALAYERDLTAAREDLRRRKDELGTLRADFDTTKASLKEKDALLGGFESKLALAAAATLAATAAAKSDDGELKAKDDEIVSLRAALESSKLKFKEAEDKARIEIETARKAAPDAKLEEESKTLRLSLKTKDDEVARLTARVNTLAPFELQIRDRDLRLKNLEAKIGDATKAKDDELVNLKAELTAAHAAREAEVGKLQLLASALETNAGKVDGELDGLRLKLSANEDTIRDYDNRLFDFENKYKETEAARKAAVGDKESDAQHFRLRLGELEAAAAGAVAALAAAEIMKPDQEAKMRDLEAAGKLQLGEKDAEVARLRLRISELELTDGANRVRFVEAETQQAQQAQQAAELKDKDAALALLHIRLKDLEPLEAKVKTVEANLASALADSDALDKQWQIRFSALEGEAGKDQTALSDAQLKLGDWESRYHLIVVERDDAKAKWQWRIGELEAFIGEYDSETEKLKRRIAELEDLNAEVAARDQRIAALTADHGKAVAIKEEDLGKLRWRVGELEAFIGERDEALGKLNLRVRELEDLDAELDELNDEIAERDKQLAALTAGHSQAVAAKDEDLGKLRWRIGELEGFVGERDEALGKLNFRIREFEGVSAAHSQAVAAKDDDLAKLRWRIGELEAFVGERDEALGKLNFRIRELETLQTEIAARDQRLASLAAEHTQFVTAHDDDLNKLRWRIGELEAFVGEREVQAKSGETRFANALKEKDGAWEARYRTTVGDKDGEIARLTARVAELGTVAATAAAGAHDKDDELKRLRLRIRELESAEPQVKIVERVVELPAKVKVKKPKADKKPKLNARQQMEHYRANRPGRGEYDDLKLIHGVGPALEKALHQLGIYYFKQVARWKEADIDWVDEQLEHFKGRIRREDWLGSATAEHVKKYNKQP